MATVVCTSLPSPELGPKDRIGSLDYIKPISKLNRRYVGPGAEFNTGQYESRDVTIRDGRQVQDKFAINKTGFFLASHNSEVNIVFYQIYYILRKDHKRNYLKTGTDIAKR
ncbi:MAG: hypothetical protein CL912_00665 [Deltaproteobacteria bacterium]|nr:hypothetical protein [Deltaproteobacteria bacterium]